MSVFQGEEATRSFLQGLPPFVGGEVRRMSIVVHSMYWTREVRHMHMNLSCICTCDICMHMHICIHMHMHMHMCIVCSRRELCSRREVRPLLRTVVASIAYGCSLHCVRLHPPLRTVAASSSCGCRFTRCSSPSVVAG